MTDKRQIIISAIFLAVFVGIAYGLFYKGDSVSDNAAAGKVLVLSCLEANNCTLQKISSGQFGETWHHANITDLTCSWVIFYITAANHTIYYTDSYDAVFYKADNSELYTYCDNIVLFNIGEYTIQNDCPWDENLANEAIADGKRF